MKSFFYFISIIQALLATNMAAQSLIKCSDKTSYWIIPDSKKNYAIKLTGDIDLSSQHDILNVNDMALQYTLISKQQYSGKADNDKTILLSYIAGETDYLRSKFRQHSFDVYPEVLLLNSDKTAVFWYFYLPDDKNKEVKAQLFINTIEEETIFGLGAPLFTENEFDSVKSFLIETLSSLTTVKNPELLCNNTIKQ
ncbi:hypothetical protein ACX0HA_15725 [Flavobacterium hauense]